MEVNRDNIEEGIVTIDIVASKGGSQQFKK
jgi:hypothetical protein